MPTKAQNEFASVPTLPSFLHQAFIYHVWKCPVPNQALCGGTEVADARVPVLAERGDTAPLKATLKLHFLLQGPHRAPLQTACVRVLRQHHIYVGVINSISFISWQKPE